MICGDCKCHGEDPTLSWLGAEWKKCSEGSGEYVNLDGVGEAHVRELMGFHQDNMIKDILQSVMQCRDAPARIFPG